MKFLALAAAIALAAFGIVRGTWAVGGSDSSCYGLMADAFAHGRLQPSTSLVTEVPWPDPPRTFAPAGFIPSPARPDAASPICAPGMSVLMAPLVWLGGLDGIFLLSPIAAALLVWFTFLLGRRLGGEMAGAVAAILIAASPIVLFQAVQPMNDIMTAALWVGAFAAAASPSARGSMWAGLLTGLAILVRPNLAPLALAVGAIVPTPSFAFGAVPGVVMLLALNHALYGSPLGSGYGNAGSLFSAANVRANASQYGRTIFSTESVFPFVGLIAPFVVPAEKRKLAWALVIAAALVSGIYAFYQPFPEWWYVRFLIPALAFMLALASAVAAHAARSVRIGGVIAIGTVVLVAFMLTTPASRDAAGMQRNEARYREAGQLVRERLPANAMLITVWQSGSMRFHASRPSVMWDALDPDWLDRAVAWLQATGRAPYILVERREEPDFRARFRGRATLGALDWPPRFDLNRQVRIFDPADRARFLAGQSYPTENIGARRRP
jgi:hypothetical protein